jgi:hypothetical protein
MMTLTRIMCQNWHAVERDLLDLNWHRDADDGRIKHMLTGSEITLWQLISIVVAAPPGTAVYHAETRSGTLTPEAQLMANLSEQQAGLIGVERRYQRAGVDSQFKPPRYGTMEALPNYKGVALTALPVNEHQAKLKELQEAARARAKVSA